LPATCRRSTPARFLFALLDTAASIEEPALKDFDFFLQNLTVE
jgi:hypothetical protein